MITFFAGVNSSVAECTTRKGGMISDTEAKLAYREIEGKGVENVLKALYCRFFRDIDVFGEEVHDFLNGEKLTSRNRTLQDFKSLLIKFEAKLAVHADSILDHFRAQERGVQSALRLAGVQR